MLSELSGLQKYSNNIITRLLSHYFFHTFYNTFFELLCTYYLLFFNDIYYLLLYHRMGSKTCYLINNEVVLFNKYRLALFKFFTQLRH